MDKLQVLNQFFGYTQFRKGQEFLIDAILQGKNVIGVMPTGAGKSLCFQVPALMSQGITLVVSPLISLMRDQVMALKQAGVPAAYLNSSLTAAQYFKALQNMKNGLYKIIYVAPERLLTDSFFNAVQGLRISILAIDEAHCISHWGKDFRPSYTQIPYFLNRLPNQPVVCAFTATATQSVVEDIAAQLQLTNYEKLITGFNRENLYFENRCPANKTTELLSILSQHKDESVIVYCNTRKAVDQVCVDLQNNGIMALPYHAGLPAEVRAKNQEDFIFGGQAVMVATNAFGMGIDKPDVRLVVHYNMPMDLESYYQEAGRAGRDGLKAQCILLYGKKDVVTNEYLITMSEENSTLSAEEKKAYIEAALSRLKDMTFYATSTTCLRHRMLKYFGENSALRCNQCSVCDEEYIEINMTAAAKTMLRFIKSTDQRFGAQLILQALRGGGSDQILRWHLDENPFYASLSAYTHAELSNLMQQLLMQEYLLKTNEQYPLIKITSMGKRLLEDKAEIFIRAKEPKTTAIGSKPQKQKQSNLSQEDMQLLKKLKELRNTLAKNQAVPAFIVFGDASLEDMCRKKPTTKQEFMLVSGVGSQKAQMYATKFTKLIAEYLSN